MNSLLYYWIFAWDLVAVLVRGTRYGWEEVEGCAAATFGLHVDFGQRLPGCRTPIGAAGTR